MQTHKEVNEYLWKSLNDDPEYRDQLDRIWKQDDCDIDCEFLGFVDTYYYLSLIIPKGRTIYDLGCGFALQAWFFRHHKKYVAVDLYSNYDNVLHTPNMEHHHISTTDFIKNNTIDKCHFAICNYVPPWGNGDSIEAVRKHFDHIYTFYPLDGDSEDED